MSSDNSKAGKTLKGQLLTIIGSPSGEPIYSSRYTYNSSCMVEFSGEAKFGTKDSAYKWFIQKYEYGSACELTAVLNACNQVTTKASQLSVDIVSNSPEVKVTIVGGLFDMIAAKDKLLIGTPSNKWEGVITQKLSDTEVLVSTSAVAVDESSTSISESELLITLLSSKDFQNRRWDKREFYIYA